MSAKDLRKGNEALAAIAKGASTLASMVCVTMGPFGRRVVYNRMGDPVVTKDGVTVAKEIKLADAHEDLGAQLLKAASVAVADVHGDGTTGVCAVANELLNQALAAVMMNQGNPIAIVRGMKDALTCLKEFILEQSIPVTSEEQVAQIAAISANNDPAIGKLVAKGRTAVGVSGSLSVEEGRGLEDSLYVVPGMSYDRGYASAYFVKSQDSQECVLEDCFVLICNKKVAIFKDLVPILQAVAERSKPLLIIAEDFDQDALGGLVLNALHRLSLCATKAPGFGDRRTEMMQDIALLTGGTCITEELGLSIDKATLGELGRAKKIVIGKDETVIIGGHGDKAKVAARVEMINKQKQESKSDFEKQKLEERAAKLSGGVAIISVGAHTEVSMKEKKMRVEDAVCATKAATLGGYLPGGGSVPVQAIPVLKKAAELVSGDARFGWNVVIKSLAAPLRVIASNAGEDADVICFQVMNSPRRHGWNALTGRIGDLVQDGVIDPTSVVVAAFDIAVELVTNMLTIKGSVVLQEKEAKAAPSHAGMGEDY